MFFKMSYVDFVIRYNELIRSKEQFTCKFAYHH